MNVEYIVVQAGGRGSRLEYLTRNKPKALVPVENLPMIFHLFRKFPDKKYLIIGDYQYEVLCKYLEAFAEVDYTMIDGRGKKGTCSGIQEALHSLGKDTAFMLIWCDLILSDAFQVPEIEGNYIGISKDFQCRWKYKDEEFIEEASKEFGVAGCFIFENKTVLEDVPLEGEFVRWLKETEKSFIELPLYKTREYGTLAEYNILPKQKCRPFNKITMAKDYVIKEAIDEQGENLADLEIAWYSKIQKNNFLNIPHIYSLYPLKLEKIVGKNVYEYSLTFEEKKQVLFQLIKCIRSIHQLEQCELDTDSFYEAYISKTFNRLEKVYNLVPFAKEKHITINGERCPNVFFEREKLEKLIWKYTPQKFCLLHGDCTFSNILLKEGKIPIMIDPRGYFGFTKYYGDPAYDWAKLYYSIVGNYDQFNLKRFSLWINASDIKLEIESNQWENMEDTFFELLDGEVEREQIRLLHAIIWLSLTTYAWEDYDSICGAFYKGILMMKEFIE